MKIARGRRKKPSKVRSVFEYLNEENVSKCRICGLKVPGQHLGNLKSHLIKRHDEFLKKINENDDLEEDVLPPPAKKEKSYLNMI